MTVMCRSTLATTPCVYPVSLRVPHARPTTCRQQTYLPTHQASVEACLFAASTVRACGVRETARQLARAVSCTAAVPCTPVARAFELHTTHFYALLKVCARCAPVHCMRNRREYVHALRKCGCSCGLLTKASFLRRCMWDARGGARESTLQAEHSTTCAG